MALISGVDFWRGSWDNGLTNGTGIQEMVDAGVKFMIAKAGQAYFMDGKWEEHKALLEAQSGSFVRGAYWFLSRDHLHIDTEGYFYPPLAVGKSYITSSYGKGWTDPDHGHNAYAVDMNATDGSDEGEAVRAAAAGTVAAANLYWDDDTGAFGTDATWQDRFGTRFINHGDYRTQYTHMKGILVNAGDVVTRGQKVGEVSTKGAAGQGDPTKAHLHHVHFKKNAAGKYVPIKMKILGEAMTASRGDTWTRAYDPNRWTGQTITGSQLPSAFPAYTGATQARLFLDALDDDPTGWLCALDVEAPPTNEYGVKPTWTQVKQFADEFWRLAPGYPLFIYARKSFWNASIKSGGTPVNAKTYGFAGLWTADWTQVGQVKQTTFDVDTATLSFQGSTETPYAGGYAGFRDSAIIQFGEPPQGLRVAGRTLDGNAYNGTVRQLKALAYGTGDPDPDAGEVPNLYGIVEATALTTLTGAGYVVGTEFTEYHLTLAAGLVTRTEPAAGSVLAAGETVDYWTSLGPRLNTVVPDVVGELEAVALDEFTEVGLVAGTDTTANSATVPVGAVISTTPAAGTAVALASAVDYVVSLGPTAPGGSNDPTPAVPCD